MGSWDFVILALILGILGLTGWFVRKAKKSGKGCIGCPDSCACSAGNCTGGCSGCGRNQG